MDEVIRNCIYEGSVVIKPARCTSGGAGIIFWDKEQSIERLKQLLLHGSIDTVIQKPIHQHGILSSINHTSVNTIRFITLLRNGLSMVLSSVLRMGMPGARVDNASAGGMTCGILDSGQLKPVAFAKDGNKSNIHPQGIRFLDVSIPNFSEAKELVCRLQARFPYCSMISWDITIDKEEKPLLIEANFARGQLDFHQLSNGPIFGNLTEDILSQIFSHYKNEIEIY